MRAVFDPVFSSRKKRNTHQIPQRTFVSNASAYNVATPHRFAAQRVCAGGAAQSVFRVPFCGAQRVSHIVVVDVVPDAPDANRRSVGLGQIARQLFIIKRRIALRSGSGRAEILRICEYATRDHHQREQAQQQQPQQPRQRKNMGPPIADRAHAHYSNIRNVRPVAEFSSAAAAAASAAHKTRIILKAK